MGYDFFVSLFEKHVATYGMPSIVNLQGQGEPTLNKDLFKMALFNKQKGCFVETVTNGTYHTVEDLTIFDRVCVSIDTLDAKVAATIGRFNLPKTLDFVKGCKQLSIPVTIYTVRDKTDNYKQVAQYCKENSLPHFVQEPATKPDYVKLYKGDHSINIVNKVQTPRTCSLLKTHRHYLVNGTMLPCTFIVDQTKFTSIETIRDALKAGQIPESCTNCRILK